MPPRPSLKTSLRAIERAVVLPVVILLAPLWASASGDFHGVKDPSTQMLASGSKVLVECDDRGFSYDMEKEFLQVLAPDTAIEAIPASRLFLPTRTYTDSDRERMLDEAGIHYILRIVVRSEDQLKKSVVVATSPTTAVAVPRNAGLAADFDVELDSRSGGPKLWVATAHYRGSSRDDVADAVADHSVNDLIKQGVLPKHHK